MAEVEPIKSFNTAQIFQSLAERYFGEKKPLNDATRIVICEYIELGRLEDKWKDFEASSKSMVIPVEDLLAMLSTATTPLAKAAFTNLSAEATPVLRHSHELEAAADEIHDRARPTFDETLVALKSVWTAKDPQSQEKQHLLEHAQKTRKNLTTELKNQTDLRSRVNHQLDELAWRLYQAQTNKKDIPRSAMTPSMVNRLGSATGG